VTRPPVRQEPSQLALSLSLDPHPHPKRPPAHRPPRLVYEKVSCLKPKKPATDNRKACALLGVDDLEDPAKFVAEAARSLAALA